MISSQYSPEHYSGDGSQDTFAFTFRILQKSDMVVLTRVVATGVVFTQVLDTNYTIADADVNTDDGGDVVFVIPPPTGTDVYLIRNTARTQLVNIEEGSPFPAATITKEFDRLTMMIQEQEYLNRQSLKFSPASISVDIDVPNPAAAELLRWNPGATALENVAASAIELTTIVVSATPVATDVSAVITHGLASATAKIIGFSSSWGTGFYVISQTTNAITIGFTTECPAGGGTITVEVTL
jgi:hypothetical protein